jgi:PHD/YefM family antitoxin component YafN of YafNO toxin-antitoxin module
MAQKEPVRVMRHHSVVGVLVSASDYEAMRAFYADRLVRTLDQTAAHAAAAALTP